MHVHTVPCQSPGRDELDTEEQRCPLCWLACVLLLFKFKPSHRFLLPHPSLYLLPHHSLFPSLALASHHGCRMSIAMIFGGRDGGSSGDSAATSGNSEPEFNEGRPDASASF